VAYPVLDDVGRRLIGALQVDGRASPEKLADARALARHPAVRAVLATTGAANLRVSVAA
jgi:DNA-binding Lrp family transcriptional regulator